MGRLKKGQQAKVPTLYKLDKGVLNALIAAKNEIGCDTSTEFVSDAIKEKACRILGKKEVKKILDAEG